MSRRHRAKNSTGTQLFVFLDVLICTMGALVVLLHIFARHGNEQAEREAVAKAQSRAAGSQADLDDVKWRLEHLRAARDKTNAQLSDERLRLAHVEDHERRLRNQLDELKNAAAAMERAGGQAANARQQHAAELAAAKSRVEAARQALAEAKSKLPSGPHDLHYSVVPYQGPNGTSRRPVYIECRENLIVLQPEGIELGPRDFVGFFGPGNPLASAVRAQREYFARQTKTGLAEEPYPLLLVRPEGIMAYYAARTALESWGSDFGYELVGSDWKLKFPDADPQLTRLTRQVVAEARLRHREYIMASPQVARSRPRPKFHAQANGGFAEVRTPGEASQMPGSWEDYAEDWTRKSGAPTSGRGGGHGGGYGDGPRGALADGGGIGNSSGGSTDAAGSFGAGDPTSPSSAQGGRRGGRSGRGGQESALPSDGHGGLAESGQRAESAFAAPEGHAGRGRSTSGGHLAGGNSSADGNSSAGGGSAAHGGSRHATGSPRAGAGTTQGEAVNSGQGGGESLLNLPNGEGAESDAAGSLGISGPTQPQLGNRQQRKSQISMAATRGAGWGLTGSSMGAVGATRPVYIECHGDRLVILSQDGSRATKEIRLKPHTQDSMDELVTAVWEQTQTWGRAGRGLYWKPTLALDVKRGGADRYAEIRALLADSGLDVHEHRPAAPVQRATRPATRR